MKKQYISLLARAASLCVLSFTIGLAGKAPGPRPMGAGSFPITPMHASAWFAHKADETGKFLTLIVFFEGTPGWHSKTTDFNWVINGSPAKINMVVGKTPVNLMYWAETNTVQILSHDFDLATNNVFLVSDVDGSAPVVKGLGIHDLAFHSEDNPALALLRRDALVRNALIGEEVKKPDATKWSVRQDPDLVAIDQQGIELLEKNAPASDKKACELFRQAATKGYAPSQYRLGFCYQSGRGVEEDQATANQWYLKAANQGHIDAQYKLGHSYRVGRGVPIDLAAALRWYTLAAENGDTEAQYNVGMMYATGQGTVVNSEKASNWYLKAAENGELGAQYEVARRYAAGDGVPKDLTTAYAWFIVLRAQRDTMNPEDWKQVQTLGESMTLELHDESKGVAEAKAQQLLRICTKQYLIGLAK